MHTLFTLLSIGLAALGAYLTLTLLRRLEDWASRRDLQFWVLLVPLVSLTLAIAALYHFVFRDCFFSAPGWDTWFAATLPIGMGVIAMGSAGIGTIRLAFIARLVAHQGFDAPLELQQMVTQQAEQLGLLRPRLLICVSDHPLALSCGLWRPTLLLSTWMINHLDARELEAVCAHEIAHAARRDYLVIWLATMLRDAFYYLPTSRIAYRQLQTEKELACDDLAVELTERPLALASALAKVWAALAGARSFECVPSFSGQSDLIETRIARLMALPQTIASESRASSARMTRSTLLLLGLVIVEVVNAAVMLGLMGCGPMATLTRLLA